MNRGQQIAKALEQLQSARKGVGSSRLDQLEFESSDLPYEMTTEDEYYRRLRQDREAAGQFLVDDEGVGYLEDSPTRTRSQRKRSSSRPSTPPCRKRQTLCQKMEKEGEMRTPQDGNKSETSDAILVEELGDMELRSQPPTPRPDDQLTDQLSGLLSLANVDTESRNQEYVKLSDLELTPSGVLPFYLLDAEENPQLPGVVYLFGKTLFRNRFISCCICVRNLERAIFVVPNDDCFRQIDELEKEYQGVERLRYIHELATPLKDEIYHLLRSRGVQGKITTKPVKRSYAFDDPRIPHGEQYVLKVKFQDTGANLVNSLQGRHFRVIYGGKQSLVESILLRRKIRGPRWIGIRQPVQTQGAKPVTWCTLELEIHSHKDLITTSSEDWSLQASPALRMISLSLQTQKSEKTHLQEVLMINLMSLDGVKTDEPTLKEEWSQSRGLSCSTGISKHTHELWPPNSIQSMKVMDQKRKSKVTFCENEAALLSWFVQQLKNFDPDVIIGHNLMSRDLTILLHRMQSLKVDKWSQIGRLRKTRFPKTPAIALSGRLLCDVHISAKEMVKEADYSLPMLSKSLLNHHQKEISFPDAVQNVQLFQKWIQQGENNAWCILGVMFHLSVIPLTKQLTNLSGNLWNRTLQGQRAHRIETLLLHEFHVRKFILPEKLVSLKGDDLGKSKGPQYAGGLVLEPKKGLYDKLVLLLDFNSLYPSIIQEYNICFTTVDRSGNEDSAKLPDLASSDPVPLPSVIKGLVDRRKQVKQILSKMKDPVQRQQLMIRQQALKLTANSMYGCLGFTQSRFYCKPLAQMITQQGREILQNSVQLVENELQLEVIYGDTDSIMINSNKENFQEVMQLGILVKRAINKRYRLLEMDIDGIFKTLLLLKKKKYAAMKLTLQNGALEEELEEKGLDTVRRDWSSIAKEAGNVVLKEILSGRPKEEVVITIHDYLRSLRERVETGLLSLNQFVIIKQLAKAPEDYPDGRTQPHVQVALRRKQQGKQDAILAGEVVPYVICSSTEASGGHLSFADRAFHPEEVQNRPFELKIDVEYYLSNQIHPVVSRLCSPIEGTDESRLAECLGLDRTKYRQSTSFGEILESQETALIATTHGLINNNTGAAAECLILHFNGLSFEFGGVEAVLEGRIQAKDVLGPPELWTDPKSRLTSAQLANQVTIQARKLISEYFDGWCKTEDDERQITRTPVYAEATGGNKRWKRVISERTLYTQLLYWMRQLDIDGVVSKIKNQKAKVDALEKLIDLKDQFAPALSILKKIKEFNRFGCINLGALLGHKSIALTRTSLLRPRVFQTVKQTQFGGTFSSGRRLTTSILASNMKIALCQLKVGKDKIENINAAKAKIKEAANNSAKLVVLPEMWNCPYANESFPVYCEPIPDPPKKTTEADESTSPCFEMMKTAAKEHGVYLVGGSVPEIRDQKLYNTCCVFSPEGEFIAKHRKVHLFDIDIPGKIRFMESETLTPGEKLTMFEAPFGKVGVGICYDIRFPEMAQLYAKSGAKLLLYPGP
eukprot:g7782.t1